jgi:hypothetical protein
MDALPGVIDALSIENAAFPSDTAAFSKIIARRTRPSPKTKETTAAGVQDSRADP